MQHHFLRGARVFLSRPMDFVASRADEKKLGWRLWQLEESATSGGNVATRTTGGQATE